MDPMGKVQLATSHHSEFRISNEKYFKTQNSRNPSSKIEAQKKRLPQKSIFVIVTSICIIVTVTMSM